MLYPYYMTDNRPTVHDFTMAVMEECGELHTLAFSIVSDTVPIPRWKETVRAHAIMCLWDNNWTPGSVRWNVSTSKGVQLPISGE